MKPITLIKNARIYPACIRGQTYDCLVISDSEILDAGDASLESEWESHADHIFDLRGHTILPGLTDAHIHLEKYAHSLSQIDCETTSLDICLEHVADAARHALPGEWIRGHGWDQNAWGRYGTLEELTAAAPENPVYLTAKSLHAAWVNLAALALCDVDDHDNVSTSDRVGHDSDGKLNGLLFEDAMKLVSEKIPRPGAEQTRKSISRAQERLLGYGITSVHDYDGSRCFSALQELHRAGELHIRVTKNIQKDQFQSAIDLGMQSGFGGDWLRIGHLKLFTDGALGPQTAAMLAPYESQPENNGILLLSQDEIIEIGRSASTAGFPLTIHAIGDRACRTVIDALHSLQEEIPAPAVPHRIEHLQIVHPADLENLSGANITISMQPLHAPSDHLTADRYWGERTRWAYAWRSVQSTDSLLIFGSDAPVETPDPWLGLYAALTRKLASEDPETPTWVPEECLDLQTALEAYSVNPPIAVGCGDHFGRLEKGYQADLIVLDQDPYEIAHAAIPSLNVLGAMTGGIWRHLDD
ncbi:MAG: amidohydrolase [Anaerolineales bacterium]|nr:amidohydrolase [Anaerolineales bacterium]